MADDAVVELDRALVLGQRLSRRFELGDDVVAGFVVVDGVGQRTLAPMVARWCVGCRLGQEGVKLVQALRNRGLVEGGIEDIDRLVLTCHDTFLWSGSPDPGVRSRRVG